MLLCKALLHEAPQLSARRWGRWVCVVEWRLSPRRQPPYVARGARACARRVAHGDEAVLQPPPARRRNPWRLLARQWRPSLARKHSRSHRRAGVAVFPASAPGRRGARGRLWCRMQCFAGERRKELMLRRAAQPLALGTQGRLLRVREAVGCLHIGSGGRHRAVRIHCRQPRRHVLHAAAICEGWAIWHVCWCGTGRGAPQQSHTECSTHHVGKHVESSVTHRRCGARGCVRRQCQGHEAPGRPRVQRVAPPLARRRSASRAAR